MSYKVERADYVVFNDGGRQELEKSVDDLMSTLLGAFDFNFVAQVIGIFCSIVLVLMNFGSGSGNDL